MNYTEWNNFIAGHFFKPENAGKDIVLYLTKQDLINYSKNGFLLLLMIKFGLTL
jgi:hypothetical protein